MQRTGAGSECCEAVVARTYLATQAVMGLVGVRSWLASRVTCGLVRDWVVSCALSWDHRLGDSDRLLVSFSSLPESSVVFDSSVSPMTTHAQQTDTPVRPIRLKVSATMVSAAAGANTLTHVPGRRQRQVSPRVSQEQDAYHILEATEIARPYDPTEH